MMSREFYTRFQLKLAAVLMTAVWYLQPAPLWRDGYQRSTGEVRLCIVAQRFDYVEIRER